MQSPSGVPQHATDVTLNHLEYYAPDADEAAAELEDRFGLRPWGSRVLPGGGRTIALGVRDIAVLVTDGPHTRAFTERHGSGVADIALRTADAAVTHRTAVAAGARSLRDPATEDGATLAAVAAFGDVAHTLVQPPAGTDGTWLPGFGPLTPQPPSSTCLERVDHFAVCLEPGDLAPAVERYERTLGFRMTFAERIEVGTQAMDSKVVQSPSGDVTLTLIEPDTSGDCGQIDRFLRDNGGAGVQHVAFSTRNVVRSVAVLAERGVGFLDTPDTYYDRLTERLTPARHPVAELRDLDILVDEDHDGQLYQIFTRSTHPRGTLFYEVIERFGARNFGSGNIRALYEAVEEAALAGQSR
ncbi:4-hydroxyphenylpyruvate dioxygenase [Streptomyces sp.]|uniref:4-hydroxyphenylpyruvate dioxygenase n=1 Tax=Streptomyces sp. TaxID=1931 RepID=UPI002D7256B9|nr:4-hydroxyphenylpyruvate dioxygenase [Streptomyces sp.]HZF89575.1 4-hydroxyphenylpyruvate dioxygenase [Streptomyces sp.]